VTVVIVANALAVAVGVGLLFVVMRTGYLVAGRGPRVDREPTSLPAAQQEMLDRAA
jgi:hypothetical protein